MFLLFLYVNNIISHGTGNINEYEYGYQGCLNKLIFYKFRHMTIEVLLLFSLCKAAEPSIIREIRKVRMGGSRDACRGEFDNSDLLS